MPIPAGLLGFLNGSIWIPVTGGLTDFEASTAATGYLLPADCVTPSVIDGGVYYYFARNTANTQWEFGAGVWDAGTNTLTRAFVFQSSSGTSKIDFVSAPTIEMGAPFAQLMALAPQAVEITYTGTFTGGEPALLLISPQVVQIGFASTLLDFKGPWIGDFTIPGSDTTLGTITFVNVIGATSLAFAIASALTSISLPELRIVTSQPQDGLSFSTLPLLTTIATPKLVYAVRAVFNGCDVLPSWTSPVVYVGAGGVSLNSCNLFSELSLPGLIRCFGAIDLGSLPAFDTLDLPLVDKIGALRLSSLQVFTTLSIPNVTVIYGEFSFNNMPLFVTVDLPLLATAGTIEVSSLVALVTFEIPALTLVQSFTVNDGSNLLETISLPVLASCPGQGINIQLDGAGVLSLIELTDLATSGGIQITGCPALVTQDCPALTTLTGSFVFNTCPALTTLTADLLSTTGALTLDNLAVLTEASYPALTAINGDGGDVQITTCPLLTTISMPGLTSVADVFFIHSLDVLDTLDLSSLASAGSIAFGGGGAIPALASINLPALTILTDGNFDIANDSVDAVTLVSAPLCASIGSDLNLGSMASVVTIDFGGLVTLAGGFSLGSCPLLTTLDLGALTTAGGTMALSGDLSSLTTIDTGSLVSTGNIDASSATITALSSVDFGSLETAQGFAGGILLPGSALTSFSLPVIQYLAISGSALDLSDSTVLTSVSLGSSLLGAFGDILFPGCALDQASVDGILVSFADLDGTGGTTSYDNKTVDLSGGTNATPGVTGLAAKLILEGRGNTVTVN